MSLLKIIKRVWIRLKSCGFRFGLYLADRKSEYGSRCDFDTCSCYATGCQHHYIHSLGALIISAIGTS